MKAIWIDEGNDADPVMLDRYEFTHAFFALRDPRLSKTYLQRVGRGVGVYVDCIWSEFQGTGHEFGTKVAAAVKPLRVSDTNPRVQLDIERHDPQFVIDALVAFRKVYPTQALSWTLESFQGGWFTPALLTAIHTARVRVVPQFYINYDGNPMAPVAQDMALRDLLHAGVPEPAITGMYDAATLPLYGLKDAFAFTQGRLKP